MAPEVRFTRLRHGGKYGCAADVWSMGVTMYVCWCASPPIDEHAWVPSEASSSFPLVFDEKEWHTDVASGIRDAVRAMCAWNWFSRPAALHVPHLYA